MRLCLHHGRPLPLHQFLAGVLLAPVDHRLYQVVVGLARRLRGYHSLVVRKDTLANVYMEGESRPVSGLSKSRLPLEHHSLN